MSIRPEVIIISSTGSMFYANVLRKMKADSDLLDLEGNVSSIRKN